MNKEINELLVNAQMLFENGEITKKLEEIQVEYKRSTENKVDIQTGFGHTFSSTSFMGFENSVKRHSID